MPRNRKLWIPSWGDERYLNLIILVLVLALLAMGFEIVRLPAVIAPNRPPSIQFIGFGILMLLSLAVTWTVARDDYVRFGYGFPRVLATFALMSCLFIIAFLVRGLWEGSYVIDPAREISLGVLATILIGGQFATMAFFVTFFFKRTDTSGVRKFKTSARAIRAFAKQLRDEKLEDDEFGAAYEVVEPDLTSIPETARSIQLTVAPEEAKFASDFAEASERVGAVLATAPTQGDAWETIDRTARESFALLAGRKESRRARRGAAA